MSLEERIESLKKIGALKDAAADKNAVLQYLTNASQYREDAKRAVDPARTIHSGLRGDSRASDGFSRSTQRQDGRRRPQIDRSSAQIAELTKGSILSGTVEAMIQSHKARNDTTYFRPIPPVTDKLAKATLKLLDAALAGAKKMFGDEEIPPSPGV